MKKLLGIVVLGLLLSSKAFAGCKEDIKWSWFINSSNTAGVFDFRNTGSKSIKLTNFTVYDSDNEKIKRNELNVYLSSGQKKRLILYAKNIRYAKGGAYQCIYDKPYGKSSTKSKKSGGFKWWYLLFIPGALAILGGIFGDDNKSKDRPAPKTNIKENKKKEEPKEEQTGPRMTGTAFFIDKKGHLITNFHVVANSSNRLKVIYEGEEIKARIIAKDETLDLALLKVSIKNESYIEISDKVLKKMQSIVAAGYPHLHLSDDLKLTSGIISSLKGIGNNSALIQIDAALNPGNSGGPIIDKDKGHLAAVAVARMEGSHYQSINYGIKASRVKEFIESNSVTLPQEAPKTKKIKRKDISEVLENSTILIYH